MTDVGSRTSEAIALMNKLRECGAQSDLDIPRIAFAGKQSAGKSSLVEALTGVQLPRSNGTCTRCPIEVTTTRTDGADWVCRIHLRLEFDDNTKVRKRLVKNALTYALMPLTKAFLFTSIIPRKHLKNQ